MSKALSPWFGLSLCTLGYLYATSNTALAQVTSDGTVNTQVNQNGNVAEITGGQTRGNNLFHSFRDFSVGTGDTASFLNANDIANIFSRVTGGNISNIDGLIRSNGSANLFLINPAGILFGENARLDVGGSFLGSTADSILFEDGEFSATDLNNPPVLTINAPIGLGFRDNPQPITNRSAVQDSTEDIVGLEVAPGNNLAFVGGNIKFEAGEATAKGGNIELGGLSAAGTVGINPDGSLSFPESVTKADISLKASRVFVGGTGGGNITINTRNLNLAEGDNDDGSGSFLLAGITADSTSPEAQAGDININATESVTLNGFSSISSITSGQGNAGLININATESVILNQSFIRSNTFGQGNAGLIDINATKSVILNESSISSITSGEGGNASLININATESVILNNYSFIDSTVTLGAEKANGGDINITTPNLSLANYSTISTGVLWQGDGGSININATESITLDDSDISSNAGNPNLSFIVNGKPVVFGQGNAGLIDINTNILSLDNSSITAQASNNSNGGNLEINANVIVAYLNGNSDILASAEQGEAGNITINADSLLGIEERPLNGLTNDINASSKVRGLDGTVNLNTPDINPVQGATELPSNVIEVEQTTDQVCQADRETEAKNGLIVKGRGGIPAPPDQPLAAQDLIINGEIVSASAIPEPIETSQGKIQLARGIKVTKDGRVILTPYPTNNAGERIPVIKPNCS